MAPIHKMPRKASRDMVNENENELKLKKEEDEMSMMDDLSISSFSGSDSNLGSEDRQFARVNRVVLDKKSDEYKKRRERNNMAVKKSRTKSKIKTAQTLERVTALKKENEALETKINILTKELNFLRDLFLAHAGNAHGGQLDMDLSALMSANVGSDKNDHKVPNGNAMQQE